MKTDLLLPPQRMLSYYKVTKGLMHHDMRAFRTQFPKGHQLATQPPVPESADRLHTQHHRRSSHCHAESPGPGLVTRVCPHSLSYREELGGLSLCQVGMAEGMSRSKNVGFPSILWRLAPAPENERHQNKCLFKQLRPFMSFSISNVTLFCFVF